MRAMKIFKRYVDESTWNEISVDEMIDKTEGRGYWEEGTALKVLKEHGEIFTPFARYIIR